MGQGYARRFVDKMIVVRGTITGPVKPLALTAADDRDQLAPAVPSLDREWCPMHHPIGHSDDWQICIPAALIAGDLPSIARNSLRLR